MNNSMIRYYPHTSADFSKIWQATLWSDCCKYL